MALSADKLRIADSGPHLLSCTADQLVVSPLNVRLNQEDATSVDALAASIAARGLLFPLIVHDMAVLRGTEHDAIARASEGKRGILAGGRRFRAIGHLIQQGRLPADWSIDVVLRDCDPATITELSLAENLLRRELRPYEIHAAVARAHAQGATVEEIAVNCGQRKQWVERQLRLGELHPEIFTAYVAGDVSLDQAMAYAATGDIELQCDAWRHFRALKAYEGTPAAIRAFLKVGDRELARNLLFVGEAIYRGNGGRFELDLFADGPEAMRGRIADEQLLATLVTEKMDVIRGQVRSAWGERELRFAARPPERMGLVDRELEVRGKSADWEKVRIPRKADPADFVATIEVDDDGGWIARLWWTSRKAKAAFESAGRGGGAASAASDSFAATALRDGKAEGAALEQHSSYEAEARRIVRDQHGLTADGINVLRGIRRDLLRALLVSPPHMSGLSVARHYLTWSGLRAELAGERSSVTGARGIAGEGWTEGEREPAELLRDQRDGQAGWVVWTDAVERCRAHPAFVKETPAADALRAFLDADVEFVLLAEAVLAGLALVRSVNSPGWRIAAHDVLAEVLGADAEVLREYWQPTAAFTGLFGKNARLEMAQPFVDPPAFKGWHKEKEKVLSGAVAGALQGAHGGDRGAAAQKWVHPLLAFDLPTAEETEAAPAAQIAEPEPVA